MTKQVATIQNPINALDILKDQLAGLKTITDKPYKTGAKVSLPGNVTVDLKTETEVDNLIKAYAYIKGRNKGYDEAMADLNITTAPAFTQDGFTTAEWKEDILTRINVITYEDKKKQLEDLIKEGEAFLTKEDQFKMYQAKLQAALAK